MIDIADRAEVSRNREFREQLVDDEPSAEELRERRNVIATWVAVNTDVGLVKHALQRYEDVVDLSSPRTDSSSTFLERWIALPTARFDEGFSLASQRRRRFH